MLRSAHIPTGPVSLLKKSSACTMGCASCVCCHTASCMKLDFFSSHRRAARQRVQTRGPPGNAVKHFPLGNTLELMVAGFARIRMCDHRCPNSCESGYKNASQRCLSGFMIRMTIFRSVQLLDGRRRRESRRHRAFPSRVRATDQTSRMELAHPRRWLDYRTASGSRPAWRSWDRLQSCRPTRLLPAVCRMWSCPLTKGC